MSVATSKVGRKGTPIDYQGRSQSLAEWARELGINYSTLYGRIHRNHWPLALAFLPENRPLRQTYRGESRSYREWAHAFGLSEQTLASRLGRGWKLGDALETPVLANGQKRKR